MFPLEGDSGAETWEKYNLENLGEKTCMHSDLQHARHGKMQPLSTRLIYCILLCSILFTVIRAQQEICPPNKF